MIDRLLYTWSTAGFAGVDQFQVVAASWDHREDDEIGRVIRRLCVPPNGERSFGWVGSDDDIVVFNRTHADRDAFNRPGNFVVQILLAPLGELLPLLDQLWYSGIWSDVTPRGRLDRLSPAYIESSLLRDRPPATTDDRVVANVAQLLAAIQRGAPLRLQEPDVQVAVSTAARAVQALQPLVGLLSFSSSESEVRGSDFEMLRGEALTNHQGDGYDAPAALLVAKEVEVGALTSSCRATSQTRGDAVEKFVVWSRVVSSGSAREAAALVRANTALAPIAALPTVARALGRLLALGDSDAFDLMSRAAQAGASTSAIAASFRDEVARCLPAAESISVLERLTPVVFDRKVAAAALRAWRLAAEPIRLDRESSTTLVRILARVGVPVRDLDAFADIDLYAVVRDLAIPLGSRSELIITRHRDLSQDQLQRLITSSEELLRDVLAPGLTVELRERLVELVARDAAPEAALAIASRLATQMEGARPDIRVVALDRAAAPRRLQLLLENFGPGPLGDADWVTRFLDSLVGTLLDSRRTYVPMPRDLLRSSLRVRKPFPPDVSSWISVFTYAMDLEEGTRSSDRRRGEAFLALELLSVDDQNAGLALLADSVCRGAVDQYQFAVVVDDLASAYGVGATLGAVATSPIFTRRVQRMYGFVTLRAHENSRLDSSELERFLALASELTANDLQHLAESVPRKMREAKRILDARASRSSRHRV